MRLLTLFLILALTLTALPVVSGGSGHGPMGGQGMGPRGGMKPPRQEEGGLQLETATFQALVGRDRPFISYGYASPESLVYNLEFISLIGYNETGDSGYQRQEGLYRANLAGNWQMGDVEEGENEVWGPYLRFNLTRSLDMRSADGSSLIEAWGTLTLNFLLAGRSFNQTLESGVTYPVEGGNELKIDVKIEVFKALPVEKLALEQRLKEMPRPGMRGPEHMFQMMEAHRVQQLNGGFNDTFEHPFRDRMEGRQSIGLLNGQGVEEGFYNWVSQAEITGNGTTEMVNTTATYATDGSGLRLYLSYPLAAAGGSIFHDPSVGVLAENLPALIKEAAQEFWELMTSYASGGVLALGTLALAVVAGRKSRKEL